MVTWARFLLIWIRLKGVLDLMARHPLRFAFAALPPGFAPAPILHGRGRYSVPDLLAGSINVLRAFSCSLAGRLRAGFEEKVRALETDAGEYLDPKQHLPAAAVSLRQLRDIHDLLAKTGTEIAVALEAFWQRGCSTASETTGKDAEARARSSPEAVRLGEEFIALQYASLIGHAMLHQRNLLVFLTTGFFLGIVSTLVYPFRSQDALAWAGTITFMLLGAPVVIAIVQMQRHRC